MVIFQEELKLVQPQTDRQRRIQSSMSSAFNFMYIIFFQCKSYSGHVKVMHNHTSHIQVMQTLVCHCLVHSPPLCSISNSGHCAQGVFEPEFVEWVCLDMQRSSRLHWKPVNIIQASSHSTLQGATAWFSSAQHHSLLFSIIVDF